MATWGEHLFEDCFSIRFVFSERENFERTNQTSQRQPALTDSRYLYTFSPRLGQIRRALRRAVRTKMEAYRRAFITTGSFEPVKHVMVRPSPLARSVDEYPDAHP